MGEQANHYAESDIRYYPDGILQPEPNPGYTELPGGWRVPVEQAPEPWWPFAVRGGIRYPKPKGTTMPERLTKAQIDHELRVNDELIKQLRERRQDLQRQAATALPAEPPSNCTMFTVSVRFTMRGKRYQFLILRSGGRYWTTGTGPEHKRFDSWTALCEWLEGPTVYDHSNIEILKGAGKVVSFDTGTIVNEDPAGEPPF